MPLRDHLKKMTADLHHQAEDSLQLSKMGNSVEFYLQKLGRFYGYYLGLNASFGHVNLSLLEFDLNIQQRIEWIYSDLKYFGISSDEISALPVCPMDHPIHTISESYGCAYVIEGSALGGRILANRLARAHGLPLPEGCRFFSGYGEETQMRWRKFVLALDQYGSNPDVYEEVTLSAIRTFESLTDWLNKF